MSPFRLNPGILRAKYVSPSSHRTCPSVSKSSPARSCSWIISAVTLFATESNSSGVILPVSKLAIAVLRLGDLALADILG